MLATGERDMNGPAENEQSMGLGKKLEPRPVISPDWKRCPELGPHIWQHKDGKLRNTPPTPKTPAEEFFDLFAKNAGGLWP